MELSAEWPECSVNMKAAETAHWGSEPIPSLGSFSGRADERRRPLPGMRMGAIPGNSTSSVTLEFLELEKEIQLMVLFSELGMRVIFLSSSHWSQMTDTFSGPENPLGFLTEAVSVMGSVVIVVDKGQFPCWGRGWPRQPQ